MYYVNMYNKLNSLMVTLCIM